MDALKFEGRMEAILLIESVVRHKTQRSTLTWTVLTEQSRVALRLQRWGGTFHCRLSRWPRLDLKERGRS